MPSSHEFPPLPPVDHLVWGGPSLEQAIDRLEVRNGRRQQSNGQVLSWQFTYPDLRAGDGLVPFLIDWGDTPHPSQATPQGCTLLNLRAEHPRPETVLPLLRALAVELPVTMAPAPALVALIRCPAGEIELR